MNSENSPEERPPSGPAPGTGGGAEAGRFSVPPIRKGETPSSAPEPVEPPAAEDGDGLVLRFRAGFLVLVALVIFCAVLGNFVARQFGLGWNWAILISLLAAVVVGFLLFKLTNKVYFTIAALITAFLGYLTYDFVSRALDWSQMTALILCALVVALVGAALYDFRRLKLQLTLWLNSTF